jgi:hypothetical protein
VIDAIEREQPRRILAEQHRPAHSNVCFYHFLPRGPEKLRRALQVRRKHLIVNVVSKGSERRRVISAILRHTLLFGFTTYAINEPWKIKGL